MKLFRKILLTVLSFGMIFTFANSLYTFAGDTDDLSPNVISSFTPKTLDECCIAFDKIFSQDQKDAIKENPVYYRGSYMHRLVYSSIGRDIKKFWLYLPSNGDKTCCTNRTALAHLLIAHGVGFLGCIDDVMAGVIFEYYSHYLNSDSVPTIEYLIVDYWYNLTCHFKTKEEHQKILDNWKLSHNL